MLLAAFATVALFTALAVEPGGASAAGLLPPTGEPHVCSQDVAGGSEFNHAGVVVAFPEGTDTYCVAFEEYELSGIELLERTGLQLVLSGFGGMGSGVCRIDDVGCSDPGDCFCQCRGADCHYWNYYELDADDWRYLPIGASQRRIHDGDIDGWVWGNGRTAPSTSSAAICPALQPTPPPTSTPRPGNVRVTTTPATAATQPAVPPPGGSGQQQPIASGTDGGDALSTSPATASITSTPAPRVVRQSSRPTSEVADAVRASSEDDKGGGVSSLVWFGVAAGGLIVVGGAIAARSMIRGR
jgi:hypothetical protein